MSAWSKLPVETQKAINRYSNAKEDVSWMGSGDPADWPAIRREYKEAKEALAIHLLRERELI